MHPDDFRFFADLLRTRLGIELGADKHYLVEARLKEIAGESGFRSVAELLNHMRAGADTKLVTAALDAMTTNETFFFRDGSPFDQLRDLLPELVRARDRAPVRIWSAASSTGQEAYSIAMVLEEEVSRIPGLRAEIVATDVSRRVLEKAKTGLYSSFEVQRGVSPERLAKHFDETPAGYRIKASLQRNISWEHANLLNGFSNLGLFDVIFCRNVLIYFSRENRAAILDRLADRLRPDGRLFLGAAETPLGLTSRLVSAGSAGSGFRRETPASARGLGAAAQR